jgi:hypothetical protein
VAADRRVAAGRPYSRFPAMRHFRRLTVTFRIDPEDIGG